MAEKFANALRKIKYRIGRALKGDSDLSNKGSRDALAGYWSKPPSKGNQPAAYAAATERSDYLIDLLERQGIAPGATLEIGCNVGRNLNALRDAGFAPLSGIEINTDAVDAMAKTFPDLHASATILNEAVETALPQMTDGQFDLTFTMAVRLHIHPDSEWIFDDMLRVTRGHLVVIENEDQSSYKIFPRKYREIFESRGAVQIHEEWMGEALPNYIVRIFRPR
jgi:SAM-dependent methyltransferase